MVKFGRKNIANVGKCSSELSHEDSGASTELGSNQLTRVEGHIQLKVPHHSDWEVLFLWKDAGVVFAGAFGFYFVYFGFLLVLSSLVDPQLVFIMQTTNYMTQTVTSLFVPSYLVRRWGPKWTLVVWLCGVIPIAMAQFWPMIATFIPAALFMALASNIVSVSSSQYLTQIAVRLVQVQDGQFEVCLTLMLSLYTALSRGGGWVMGTLLPHLVLREDDHAEFEFLPVTSCGANFCAHHISAHPREPKAGEGRIMLFVIYASSALFGPLLTGIFLNDRRGSNSNETPPTIQEQLDASFMGLKAIGLPAQISSIFTGFLLTFAASDFTEAFVVCIFGTAIVSPVATAFSATFLLASLLTGPVVRFIGVTACLHIINAIAIVIFFMLIVQTPTQLAAVLVISGGLGAVCSVHISLDATLCGLALEGDQELGYSAQQFLMAVGAAVGFATATRVCVLFKLTIALILVLLSSVLFCCCSIRERGATNSEEAQNLLKP